MRKLFFSKHWRVPLLILAGVFLFGIVHAAPVTPTTGGGTNTSTIPSKGSLLVGASTTIPTYGILPVGVNGSCPVASSGAALGIAWQSCGSGSFATTTINTVLGPNFTLTVATSNTSIPSWTGTALTIPGNLSNFVNDVGFVTSTGASAATGTPFNFPYFLSSGTGLSVTSSITQSSSTGEISVNTTTFLNGAILNINGQSSDNAVSISSGNLNFGVGWGIKAIGAQNASGEFFTNTGVGIGNTAPVSKFTVGVSSTLPQGITATLVNLGGLLIQGGNVSGTLLGANLAAGIQPDFINFEENSSSFFNLTSSSLIMSNLPSSTSSPAILIGQNGAIGSTTFIGFNGTGMGRAAIGYDGTNQSFDLTTGSGNKDMRFYVNGTSLNNGSLGMFISGQAGNVGDVSIGTSTSLFSSALSVYSATTSGVVTYNGTGEAFFGEQNGSNNTLIGSLSNSADQFLVNNVSIARFTATNFDLGGTTDRGGLSVSTTLQQTTTSSLILAGGNTIVGGSASGTYYGANAPLGFNGDFENFEVNSSSVFKNTNSSTIIGSNNLFDAGGNKYVTSTASGVSSINNGGTGAYFIVPGTNITITTTTTSTIINSTGGGSGGGIVTSTQGSYAAGNIGFFVNSSTESADNNFNWATSTVTLNLGNNFTVAASGSPVLTGSSGPAGTELEGPTGSNVTIGGTAGGINITTVGGGAGGGNFNLTTSGNGGNINITASGASTGAITLVGSGGITLKGAVTLSSTTNALASLNNNGTFNAFAGSTCSGGQAANGISATGTFTGCFTPGGTGTVTTSTAFTTNTIPIINGATSIGNSTLTQPGGGVTAVGGVPFIDGAGDFIGPNIFINGANSVISQNTTGTTAVGNFVQGGGVTTFNTTTTLSGTQFCAGGFFNVQNTTGSITITIPTTSTIAASPCGASVYAGTFSQQFLRNNSTNTVFVAINGTGEQQLFSAGTPTSLAPGQEYSVFGQFENTSTVQGATSTNTTLVVKYTEYQTSTLANQLVYATSTGAYLGLTLGTNLSISGSTLNAASGGAVAFKYATWTVGPSNADFTTIQAAENACATAGGGVIYVASGTFALATTGVTFKGSNCALWGQIGATTVTITGATTAFKEQTSTSQLSHDELHNLIITGDGNTSGVAIDASDMSHNIYDNIVVDSVGTFVKLHDTQDVTFYNVFSNFDATTLGKFGVDGSSTEPWNANTFQDGFIGCGTAGCIGLNVGNSEENTFTNIRIEPNGSPLASTFGVKIFDSNVGTNPGTFGNQFINDYLEGNAVAINVSSSKSSGQGVDDNQFIGGLCDTNCNLQVATSTQTQFLGFNNNFVASTILPNPVIQNIPTFTGSSTILTAAIGGAIVSGGCDSGTTTVDSSVVTSTSAFVTTPANDPGTTLGGTWAYSFLSSANTITTRVCANVSVTPNSVKYVVKIFN